MRGVSRPVVYQHALAYLLGLEGLALLRAFAGLYDGEPSPDFDPDGAPNIWALHPFAVAATNAAWAGRPAAIVWHFQLT